jgi:hypothetical protein
MRPFYLEILPHTSTVYFEDVMAWMKGLPLAVRCVGTGAEGGLRAGGTA